MFRKITFYHYFKQYTQCLTLLISLFIFNVHAETLSEYFAADEKVMLDPWGSYQSILKENDAYQAQAPSQEKLLFLLRKAQIEHLLNYLPKFVSTIKQAEKMVKPDTPVAIQSRLNFYMGIVARINSEYQRSQDYLNIALAQAKANNMHSMTVLTKQQLAYTHANHDLYDVSLKELQEAYVVAFNLDDDYLIAIINETYGVIYGYLHDYELAIEYLQKARNGFEQLNYPAQISNSFFALASTFRYWKKYDKAIKYFELNLKISLYSPDMEPSFYSLYGLAITVAEQGNCESALIKIEKALELPGVADFNAELYKAKAECLIKLNKLEEAEVALNEVKNIFKQLPEVQNTTWHIEVFKIESKLALAQGYKNKAYHLLDEYYEKQIALIKANSSSKLLKMQAVMGVEQQNIELNLLQQQAKVQDLILEQSTQHNKQLWYLIIFGLCLILTIVGAFIFQRNYNKKLFVTSITDSLTGLYNRHYIFEYLTKIINGRASIKHSMSVIILDIDDFKMINDKYGHPFGDSVIKVIAELTQDTLRIDDVMGRIGGEEFLCVLPRISQNQCHEIAQRIVKNINQHTFFAKQKEVKVTVSVGIANATTDMCNTDSLYSQADEALYESKSLGKNRVSIYRGN